MDPGFDAFVGADTTAIYRSSTGRQKAGHLLWGDGLRHLAGGTRDGRTNVRARGRDGWVDTAALGGRSLLEFYYIDVGQGDGTLIKTPDFRHILIDGGYTRAAQPTRKSAADFVDWKFFEDYGSSVIALDAMIASHNDFDHYGGLADLLDVEQNEELDADTVTVETFYHAGVSWWRKPRSGGAPGFSGRWLGEVRQTDGTTWLVQLLGDRTHAVSALDATAPQQLQGEWAEFIAKVVATKTGSGVPTPIVRLGRDLASIAAEEPRFLPGFVPADGDLRIHVLAPVPRVVDGRPALQRLSADEAQNTNGHSVLLRVDYGRTRTLLTGDLNKRAQRTLLADYVGQRLAFKCDVAKACHHGSEDVFRLSRNARFGRPVKLSWRAWRASSSSALRFVMSRTTATPSVPLRSRRRWPRLPPGTDSHHFVWQGVHMGQAYPRWRSCDPAAATTSATAFL